MKLHYYPQTDSLYIELNAKLGADAIEISDGIVVDVDANGDPVGIDIDQASQRLDLTDVETIDLPPARASGR